MCRWLRGRGTGASRQSSRRLHQLRWAAETAGWIFSERSNSSQQAECGAIFALHLLHGAVARRFFGAPAQEFGAVAKAAASEVIELNLSDELGIERLPFGRTLGAPAARTSGSISGEARRLHHLLELFGQVATLFAVDRRCEADMIEQSFIVIQAQQQRTY